MPKGLKQVALSVHPFFSAKSLFRLLPLALLLMQLGLSGCRVYSFSGSSLSPDVKTLTILNFPDRSGQAPPYISQRMSETFREYFQTTTSLTQVASNGDLQIEGFVSGYQLAPVAITAADQPAANRLTITISVKYTNRKEEGKDFETNFSQFQDFPPGQPLTSIESQLIQDISRRLAIDIFNRTVADW